MVARRAPRARRRRRAWRPSSRSASIRSSSATSRSSSSLPDLGLREVVERELRERWPAPQRERALRAASRRSSGGSRRASTSARSNRRASSCSGLDAEDVAGRPGLEHVGAERLPEPRDAFWSDVVAVRGGSSPHRSRRGGRSGRRGRRRAAGSPAGRAAAARRARSAGRPTTSSGPRIRNSSVTSDLRSSPGVMSSIPA